jgi:hypothetical protein
MAKHRRSGGPTPGAAARTGMPLRRFGDEATTPLRQRGWPDALPPNGERDTRHVEGLLDGLSGAALADACRARGAVADAIAARALARAAAIGAELDTRTAGAAAGGQPARARRRQAAGGRLAGLRRTDNPRALKEPTPPGLSDTGEVCECGAVVWRRYPDGRKVGRYVPGRTKGCGPCGRTLRRNYWRGYGQVLAAAGPLWRWVVTDAEWVKARPRLVRQGAQALPVPAPEGRRVVYTTAERGAPVVDVGRQLAEDLAAMPNDSRRLRATGSEQRPGWQQAWNAWRDAHDRPAPAEGEYLGASRKPLAHQRMVAAELGILAGDLADRHGVGLVLRPCDPGTWRRFCALVGLQRRGGDAVDVIAEAS